MNRISINEPCHENWAAMTPSEQGAFCGKCQIDVIDFSKKSPLEVKLILQENIGKHLCGRFKKTQLEDLNASYVEWENQSMPVFQSKFLYACVLVFGMTLFSCNTPQDMVVGEISFENNSPVEQVDQANTANNETNISNEDNRKYLQDNPKYLKGKVAYNPPVDEPANCTIENEFIKGDISINNESAHVYGQFIVNTDTTKASGEAINEIPVTENLVAVESGLAIVNDNFTGRLYPNPTGTMTTLVLDIKKTGIYHIELFSVNGEKVIDFFSGELAEGESNHRIDLSVCKNGTYLLRVRCGNQLETFKILKTD